MTQVSMARVDAVLRDTYRMLPSTRRKVLAHVFGRNGQVLAAHVAARMQEEPYHWTEPQATALAKACLK